MKRNCTFGLLALVSTLTSLTGAITPQAQAALVHQYQFSGDYSDSVGSIALTGNGGSFSGGELIFGQNEGPTLQAEASLTSVYSMGLRFSLDALNGYRKVLDFKDRASDSGQYLLDSNPEFFPVLTGTGSVNPGVLVDLVVTRDAANTYSAYLNGSLSFSFTDSTSLAVSPTAIYQFFRDDLATGGRESSSGKVDEIRVWNTALSASDVADAFAPVVIPEPPTYLAGALLALPFGAQVLRRLRSRKLGQTVSV